MFRPIAKYVPTLLGLLLLYSGAYKMLRPGEATLAIASLDFPYWVAHWTVIVVTGVEIYLGVILLGRIDLRYGLAATTGLIFVFTAFLWYLSTLANPPACGCLGLTGAFESGKKGAVLGIARNCVILWLLKLSRDYYFGNMAKHKAGAPSEHATAA
jgi:hypothetical protein